MRPPDPTSHPALLSTVPADLAGSAARGARATLVGQVGKFLLQLAYTAVLARLVTPDDVGLVAMVTVVFGLAELFRDFGLADATVQRARLTHAQTSAVFWVQVAVGVVLTIVTAASAPLLAGFYERPELTALATVLSITFLINAATSQHQALLVRGFRLKAVARIDLGSFATGAVAGLVIAALGGGPWAIVGQVVSTAAVRAFATCVFSGWWPTRPRPAPGVRALLTFGRDVSVFNLLNYVSRNIDNLLIGRVFGAEALGLYVRAYSLLMLPLHQVNGPLSRTAVPTLSRLQEAPDRYCKYFLALISLLAHTCMPLIVLLAVLAEDVVRVVYGDAWLGVVPLFQVFAVAGFVSVVGYANGWLYTTTGRTGRQAAWALFSRPVLVVGMLAGLPWGPLGVATGFATTSVLLAVPGFWFATRGSPVTMASLGGAAWRPAVACVPCGAAAWAVHSALDEALSGLLLGIAGGGASFVVVLLAWPTARGDAVGLLTSLRRAFRGGA